MVVWLTRHTFLEIHPWAAIVTNSLLSLLSYLDKFLLTLLTIHWYLCVIEAMYKYYSFWSGIWIPISWHLHPENHLDLFPRSFYLTSESIVLGQTDISPPQQNLQYISVCGECQLTLSATARFPCTLSSSLSQSTRITSSNLNHLSISITPQYESPLNLNCPLKSQSLLNLKHSSNLNHPFNLNDPLIE